MGGAGTGGAREGGREGGASRRRRHLSGRVRRNACGGGAPARFTHNSPNKALGRGDGPADLPSIPFPFQAGR